MHLKITVKNEGKSNRQILIHTTSENENYGRNNTAYNKDY